MVKAIRNSFQYELITSWTIQKMITFLEHFSCKGLANLNQPPTYLILFPWEYLLKPNSGRHFLRALFCVHMSIIFRQVIKYSYGQKSETVQYIFVQKIVILIILGILTTLTENGTASDKYQNVANMAKPKNNFDGMVLKLGS